MKKLIKMPISMSIAALALAVSPMAINAQNTAPAETPPPAPSPNQIVEQAATDQWVAIAPTDLLVMDLAPGADGSARRVVIQLMPEPFSQGWIRNIRKLAAAKWWDGTSINRVQDNYVTQWGSFTEEGAAEKPLPDGLEVVPETDYVVKGQKLFLRREVDGHLSQHVIGHGSYYSEADAFFKGWPYGLQHSPNENWPVHCYGMVGVGRNLSPDTGSGAELYTVIGHAPRHLDRNIALVGRIIEGMEHMSSLPRGKGFLGFYEDPSKRVPIVAVRLATDLADGEQLRFEYLDTDGQSFAEYADARANRRDPFFNVPAGGADICNIPVPVRRVSAEAE